VGVFDFISRQYPLVRYKKKRTLKDERHKRTLAPVLGGGTRDTNIFLAEWVD